MSQKRKAHYIAPLITLVVLIGAVYAIVKFISFILIGLKSLKPEIGVAVIASCGTILVSVLSILVSKWLERRSEIRREQQCKKIEIYENFIGTWFDFLFANKFDKPMPSEKEIFTRIAPIIRQMVPWGSDEVIKSFVKFRDVASKMGKDDENTLEMLNSFEKLLLDIRKDLGHSCRNLESGDLLKLFITDYDKFKNTKD